MKKKILVVDDEPDLVAVLKTRLEIEGYEVISANDGVEGFQKAMDQSPDLILLDIMMPRKDGFSMLRDLRANDSTQRIPVIMLSARGETGALSKCQELGAQGYLVKPCVPSELSNLIRRHLQSEFPL